MGLIWIWFKQAQASVRLQTCVCISCGGNGRVGISAFSRDLPLNRYAFLIVSKWTCYYCALKLVVFLNMFHCSVSAHVVLLQEDNHGTPQECINVFV